MQGTQGKVSPQKWSSKDHNSAGLRRSEERGKAQRRAESSRERMTRHMSGAVLVFFFFWIHYRAPEGTEPYVARMPYIVDYRFVSCL